MMFLERATNGEVVLAISPSGTASQNSHPKAKTIFRSASHDGLSADVS